MEVIGSFILGLDGEKSGAGERICAFIEQTEIPVTMLGVLQAAPNTRLWHRLEKEGRLRRDMGDDMGTFSGLELRTGSAGRRDHAGIRRCLGLFV